MSNIYDLANELSRNLRTLPEYQAAAEAKKAVDADSSASKILTDYWDFQTELQNLAQAGQMPTQEHQDKMQAFGLAIQSNPALKTFFDKQQALSIYLADMERIIFEPVHELMK